MTGISLLRSRGGVTLLGPKMVASPATETGRGNSHFLDDPSRRWSGLLVIGGETSPWFPVNAELEHKLQLLSVMGGLPRTRRQRRLGVMFNAMDHFHANRTARVLAIKTARCADVKRCFL